jgi:hypothetical protein
LPSLCPLLAVSGSECASLDQLIQTDKEDVAGVRVSITHLPFPSGSHLETAVPRCLLYLSLSVAPTPLRPLLCCPGKCPHCLPHLPIPPPYMSPPYPSPLGFARISLLSGDRGGRCGCPVWPRRATRPFPSRPIQSATQTAPQGLGGSSSGEACKDPLVEGPQRLRQVYRGAPVVLRSSICGVISVYNLHIDTPYSSHQLFMRCCLHSCVR